MPEDPPERDPELEQEPQPEQEDLEAVESPDEILKRIQRLRESVETRVEESDEIDDRLRTMRAEEETEVRRFVTRVVIMGYGGVVAATILLVFGTNVYLGGAWPEELSTWLRDLLLATVMPIVTLVLGYYFGSASR